MKKKSEASYTYSGKRGASWIRSRHAVWILAAISFAESVFAPILIDPFLVGLIMAHRRRWKRYILVAISASIAGGVFAYYLGLLFFDTFGTAIIDTYGLEEQFTEISKQVDASGFVFVLIGAFTPIPYKLVALASGFLHVNIITFIVASIFGRIFRLGLVGLAAYAFNPRALPLMQRHHYKVALVMAFILITYITYRWFM